MTKTLSKIKHSVQGTISHSESYLSRLVKYIPSEVIALYLTLDSILRSSDPTDPIYQRLYWGIFVFGLVATPLYQYRIQKLENWFQLLISTIAFAVWVIAIGGPFVNLDWYKPLYGAILLPIVTFLIPLFLGEESSTDRSLKEFGRISQNER
jgi:hypothetical protein